VPHGVVSGHACPGGGATGDADWYRDAVIYEVPVGAFADGDGDGVGDLRGLTERLDHLLDLGVTALWLLPFYPSPLRDGGYDISDYRAVHPRYGTLRDFARFLEDAQARGLRVITELVLNHTAARHPWFQRARRAPSGSPERHLYVWSATPAPYRDARIIFSDFEASNWAWDPVAGAYYWHRFYAHQPDLNYGNPRVRRAVLEVVDFWLGLGVDGLRLDAVPFLFEREGTTCESLPDTHAFLRALRAHVDARFPGRVLLAEANQHPAEAAAYFGRGDEAHMAFHFPLMPRLFLAVATEDRSPLVDILRRTPPIPEPCQWAVFLRNHDELSLEMVSDGERALLQDAFAPDRRSLLNTGIRRRLSPLLGGDRTLIELMNGLLFSLAGTPVIYYGDEVGMGDDPSLPDRDGLRLPMRWDLRDGQRKDPGSLLRWMRRLIELRKRIRALGRGSLQVLEHPNPRVLAFVRRSEDQVVLVVANLSASMQEVSLDLSWVRGSIPREVLADTPLPPVTVDPYRIALGGHRFAWLLLEPAPRREPAEDEVPVMEGSP
jgi:maltose alpha-D-glucosyltransferase/alpha-amylase